MFENNNPIEWTPKNLTLEDAIIVYACVPLGIVGFALRLVIIWVFSSSVFKDKSTVYLKISCVFVSMSLFLITIRSIATYYMCMSPLCQELNLNQTILKTYVFIYLPSPIEASALSAQIFALHSHLAQSKLKKPTGLRLRFLNSNPYRVMLITFVTFAILFSYQFLCNPLLFDFKFFRQHFKLLSILTFTIRDFVLLAILMALLLKIKANMKKSMDKKVRIMGSRVIRRASKAKCRANIIILIACACSIVGRLPILVFIIAGFFHKPGVYGFLVACFLSQSVSYIFEFFIFFFLIGVLKMSSTKNSV